MDEREVEFLADFIAESERIENMHPDPAEIRRHLATEENGTHACALLRLREMADQRLPLDKATLCLIQNMIVRDQEQRGGDRMRAKHIGQYRDCNVQVANRLCPTPVQVPELMAQWLRGVNDHLASPFSNDHLNVKQIGLEHFNFEWVHPFADGNGRTGRALTYYMFRYLKLRPFVFTSHDKVETYYRSFANAMTMGVYFTLRSLRHPLSNLRYSPKSV